MWFTDTSGVTQTRQVWDPLTANVLQDLDGSNALSVDYAMGNRIDEPLARVAGGATHTFVSDHLASVRALSNSAGSLVNQYTYAAYGSGRSVTEAVSNRLRFTARELDEATALQFNRNRYYSPAVGRWTQRDPLGFAGGVNLYGYVGNNPINFRDPSGLDPGQLFRTLADAGEDAIRYYNPQSIRTGRNGTEFGGVIYRTRNGRFFSYTRAVPAGTKASTDVGTCPRGTTEVADYHTHGKHIPGYEDEEFSDSDKQGNDDFNGGAGEFGFLGTPSGRILMYTPVPGNPLGGTTDVIGYGAHLPYRKRR